MAGIRHNSFGLITKLFSQFRPVAETIRRQNSVVDIGLGPCYLCAMIRRDLDMSDTDRAKLILAETLAFHGFVNAARNLPTFTDWQQALAAWKNYPRNMERYPKKLKRPSKRW